jgi:hypothetical protein
VWTGRHRCCISTSATAPWSMISSSPRSANHAPTCSPSGLSRHKCPPQIRPSSHLLPHSTLHRSVHIFWVDDLVVTQIGKSCPNLLTLRSHQPSRKDQTIHFWSHFHLADPTFPGVCVNLSPNLGTGKGENRRIGTVVDTQIGKSCPNLLTLRSNLHRSIN